MNTFLFRPLMTIFEFVVPKTKTTVFKGTLINLWSNCLNKGPRARIGANKGPEVMSYAQCLSITSKTRFVGFSHFEFVNEQTKDTAKDGFSKFSRILNYFYLISYQLIMAYRMGILIRNSSNCKLTIKTNKKCQSL